MVQTAIELRDIHRTFTQGGVRLKVLRGSSVAVPPGELVALLGPSGAGKSTLLHIAGLLERADAGEVVIAGTACGRMSEAERTRTRRESLGFVYQFHHLLPEFSALENVMLPQMIAGVGRAAARTRAKDLLARLGLKHRESHRPAKLSGGEQQRVALARAIANGPRVLLADEPTGNLDHDTAAMVFDEIVRLVHADGLAALVATHNTELARRMDRTLRLQDGVLVEQ